MMVLQARAVGYSARSCRNLIWLCQAPCVNIIRVMSCCICESPPLEPVLLRLRLLNSKL